MNVQMGHSSAVWTSRKKDGCLCMLLELMFMTSALQQKRRERVGLEKMSKEMAEML